MPRLLIMAGGTGGHVFPGLAVAHYMQTIGWQIDWMGTADKMEAELVPKHGISIHFIDIGGVRGKGLATKLKTPFRLLKAFMQARKLLKKLQPNAVLGMGGYASGPGGLAAYTLGIPLLVHEQNAVFGMTNKYLSKLAAYTLTGFDLSHPSNNLDNAKKLHFVGNPIRNGFFTIPEMQVKADAAINILIVGGSLGALALNQQVPSILKSLMATFTIAVKHQSGKNKQLEVIAEYENLANCDVLEFIDDMESTFAWADIIICRAGALTVAEVAGSGRAAIFVPLPIAVDDHQTANARSLSDNGAAILLPQTEIKTSLKTHLMTLCEHHKLRLDMGKKARQLARAEATQAVSEFICKANEHSNKSKPNKHGASAEELK